MIIALLNQLVNVAGVAQNDIYIGDPIRPFTDFLYTRCTAAFPNVHYMDAFGLAGRELATYTGPAAMFYSNHPPECINGVTEPGVEMTDQVADYIYNADYFINLSDLKREGSVGSTLAGKNHFGVMNRSPAHVHDYIHGPNGWETGWGDYNVLVDDLGNKYLGGAYPAVYDRWSLRWFCGPMATSRCRKNGVPCRRTGSPGWPSSLFVSHDPIAMDSVGLDFLIGEVTQGG